MLDELKNNHQSHLVELLVRLYGGCDTRVVAFLLVCNLCMPDWVDAEPAPGFDENESKVFFLYNFSKFVKWPSRQANEQAEKTFDICILGKNFFGEAASNLVGKTTGGAQVTVNYINDIPVQDECHILYISKSESGRLKDVLETVANQPVLTVSDIDGFVESGGCIEFSTHEDQTDFTINSRAANHSQLQFSAKLLELSKPVVEK